MEADLHVSAPPAWVHSRISYPRPSTGSSSCLAFALPFILFPSSLSVLVALRTLAKALITAVLPLPAGPLSTKSLRYFLT